MCKRLMVLGAGILQVPVIKKAKEMGYYAIAVDGNKDAIGLPLASKAIVANITDPELMLQIATEERIHGVIHPCSEVAMNSMGYINEKMNLSGISREVILAATNKQMMRKAFADFGAPSPMSWGLSDKQELQDIFKYFSGDVIFKPSRNSGSRGVTKIVKGTSCDEIEKAFDRALFESRDHSVVIEDFIEGPEFSVEIVIWNHEIHVLTVTDKKTTGSPYFVELGHNQPSLFSESEVVKVKKAAIQGVKALYLNNCVAHAEVKLSKQGPFLMEIGARLGGDFISTELVHLSTGIDMVAAAINIALGIAPNLCPITQSQGAAIRYFIPKPGIVKSIDNLEEANHDYVYDFEIYKQIGEEVPIVKSSIDRSGHVITVGKNAQEAVCRAEHIIKNVNILTE